MGSRELRILCIGDTHIPSRAPEIPNQLKSQLLDLDPDLIACTGDLTHIQVLQYLESIAPVRAVLGNMDYLELPEHQLIDAGKLRLGLIHGDQVHPRGNKHQLTNLARRLGADVLISGHTHSLEIINTYPILVNPGSATGAWGGGGGSGIPSMLLLQIHGDEVQATSYELLGSKLRILRHDLR